MAGGRRLEVPGSEHSPTTPLQPAAGGQYTAEPGSSDAGEGEPDAEPQPAETSASCPDGSGASAGAAEPEHAGGVEPPGGATASAPSGKEGAAAAAGTSPGAGPAASRRPPAGEPAPVLGHGYAVWYIPGRPELAGVHLGGHRAWVFIESTLPDRRYGDSGARLRRAESQAEAIALYCQEARYQRVPREPLVILR